MEKFSPVKLLPAFKDYLWGGVKLKEEYGKKSELDIVAESWELSCHKDGESKIFGGEFDGKTLSEYILSCGKEILGTNAEQFDFFPILIKFIDAKSSLSIQVHPDDEYARRVENEYGKTEMWYILEADDDAYIYYGFNRTISRDEYRERIKNNTLLEVLNKVPTKKGDVFFIEAGTVHAIGGGNVICEIQQNSNSTYRVYDYDRRDKFGNPRELHIDKAIDVSNLSPAPAPSNASQNGILASCKYFTAEKINVCGDCEVKIGEESFRSIIVTSGECEMIFKDEKTVLKKGNSIFVPAQNGVLAFSGNAEIIISRV